MARVLIDSSGRFVLAGARGFLDAPPGTDTSGGGSTPPPPDTPVNTLSITVSDFYSAYPQLAYPVVQRRAGTESLPSGGEVDVTVLFSYTGEKPTDVQGRAIDKTTKLPVTPWVSLLNLTCDDTTKTGSGKIPSVPLGMTYLTNLRVGTSSTVTCTGTQGWGVGVNAVPHGQSNQNSTLSAGGFNDPVPGSAYGEWDNWMAGNVPAALFGTSGWFPPNGNGQPVAVGGGSNAPVIGGGTVFLLRTIAQGLAAKHGKKVPVGLIPWAWNGNSLAMLSPGGQNGQIFTNSGATAGSMGFASPANIFCGDFEVILPYQGEADASAGAKTRAQRRADLNAFCQAMFSLVAPFGRSPAQLAVIFGTLGGYSSADTTNIEAIRLAVSDLEIDAIANGWDKVRCAWNAIDMDAPDGDPQGLHFQEVGTRDGKQYRKINVRRELQAALWATGCSSYSARGPRLTEAYTRNGNTITLAVQHDGGTQLTTAKGAGAITGWSVVNASGAVAATVTVLDANHINVVCPAGTTYPVTIQHCGGQRPDSSNLITDDVVYPYVRKADGTNAFSGTDVISKLPLMPSNAITVS